MPDAAREGIVQAVLGAVTGLDTTGTRAYRSRTIPLNRDISPAIIVRPMSERVESQGLGPVERFLTVSVEALSRAAVPDQEATTILKEAHASIFSNATLSPLVQDIIEGDTNYEYDDADLGACLATVEFIFQYRTERTSLE